MDGPRGVAGVTIVLCYGLIDQCICQSHAPPIQWPLYLYTNVYNILKQQLLNQVVVEHWTWELGFFGYLWFNDGVFSAVVLIVHKYLLICYDSLLFCLAESTRPGSEEQVPLYEEFIYCCGAATQVLKCGPWKDLLETESKTLPRLLFLIIPGKSGKNAKL